MPVFEKSTLLLQLLQSYQPWPTQPEKLLTEWGRAAFSLCSPWPGDVAPAAADPLYGHGQDTFVSSERGWSFSCKPGNPSSAQLSCPLFIHQSRTQPLLIIWPISPIAWSHPCPVFHLKGSLLHCTLVMHHWPVTYKKFILWIGIFLLQISQNSTQMLYDNPLPLTHKSQALIVLIPTPSCTTNSWGSLRAALGSLSAIAPLLRLSTFCLQCGLQQR